MILSSSSSSSSSKLLILRRRRLCAKNAHGWCGGERSPTNLGKKSQLVGYNTGKSLLCMENHVPVYVEGSRCKESRVHVDYMGRRFSRMIMGEEEGNPVVGYAQGRRRSCSSSSRRRIWDRNRNRCWRGRSTMTLIGPECGHLLFCTLSACAAFAQVKEKEKFFSLQGFNQRLYGILSTKQDWSMLLVKVMGEQAVHVSLKNTNSSVAIWSSSNAS